MPPYVKDYQSACLDPGRAFTYSDLQRAQLAMDSWGLPSAIVGSMAVVFKATIGTGSYALRCYTSAAGVACRDRYAALSSVIADRPHMTSIPSFTWRDDAIRVNGATWPVLQMEWIEGRTLDHYVGNLAGIGDTDSLGRLARRWRELIAGLQQSAIAHGDLQHGNILVDHGGQLRLVDLDSVWVPQMADQPPPEIGHENYQHPGRRTSAGWGRWVDTFSALVIYLSLMALAIDPELWPLFYQGENLLFAGHDFRAPADAEIWKRLVRLADPEVDRLSLLLRDYCMSAWTATESLEAMLRQSPW